MNCLTSGTALGPPILNDKGYSKMIRSHSLVSALAVAIALPAAAWADCPTGPATDGVYMTFPDMLMRYEVQSDGTILETETNYKDGEVWQHVMHPTGLVFESWELVADQVVADSIETVTYSTPLPDIAPNSRWDIEETARFSDGFEIRYFTEVEVLSPTEVGVEDCSYIGWPVNVRRTDLETDEAWVDAQMYLPELEILVYLASADAGERPDIVPPQTISAQHPDVSN